MKNSTLQRMPRILALIGSLLLIGSLVLPIWRIDLLAPQYPEGIYMQIYATKLEGDVDIINGLNHYIGMAKIHQEDFIEFKILPVMISFFILLGIITFLVKRRWMLQMFFVLFMVFAALSMYDFWRWEYDYGHNLDPTAPIQIPDMAYQPPLIGHKKLANFDAWSFPDSGGWLFIACGLLQLLALYLHWRFRRSVLRNAQVFTLAILFTIISAGCSRNPIRIDFGKDACDFCRMKIMDSRFGAEILNDKGKAFKFDDLACAEQFMKATPIINSLIYVVDFEGGGTLIPAETAFFLACDNIHTPMGGNVCAFANKETASQVASQYEGNLLEWELVKPNNVQ